MRNTMLPARVAVYVGMVLLVLFLFGCTQVGQEISAGKMISFEETLAEGEGSFSRGALHIDYSYDRNGDRLRIWGSVSYSLPVESLDVYLLFVDAGRTVIDQEWLYSTGYDVSKIWGRSGTFERTLEVPDGAAAISFDSSAILSRGQR